MLLLLHASMLSWAASFELKSTKANLFDYVFFVSITTTQLKMKLLITGFAGASASGFYSLSFYLFNL